MNILSIVVVYNVDFKTTNVYRSLFCGGIDRRILIYENSQEPQNKHYADEKISYFHDSSNGGVSAAYNYGAELARSMGDVDSLLLLDEDTQFQKNYISILEDALAAYPQINLFVPQVLYAGDRPFSPVLRGIHLKRGVKLPEGVYSLKDYLPVNSGACIRLSAFEQTGGYHPGIRLDFADFEFFSRLAMVSDAFYRVGSVAQQSFSNEETQVEKLYGRFKFYIDGAKVAVKSPHIKFVVIVGVILHTIALTCRTRSLRFLIYLFHNL